MAKVLRADAHFLADHMGNALAKLHFVDGLMLRLLPPQDEDGNLLSCPITLAPIVRNAAMIEDGSIYQLGYITQWLEENNRSPLTNLPLSGHL